MVLRTLKKVKGFSKQLEHYKNKISFQKVLGLMLISAHQVPGYFVQLMTISIGERKKNHARIGNLIIINCHQVIIYLFITLKKPIIFQKT